MPSIMGEFYRTYGSAVEIGIKQDDAAAKRAAAVQKANQVAAMRAVLARHQASQPAPPVQPPNTDLSSVGDPNALPLDGGSPPGGMPGAPGPPGGQKPPTLFGDTARPQMSDMASQLRELGEAAVASGDFKTGRQFLKDSVTAQKKASEIDTEHLKQQADMAHFLGSIAKGVHDQKSFTNAMMIASMHGMAPEAAQLYQMTGGQYGPQAQAILDQFAESSMSVKEQAQGQIAAAKLANDNRRTESIIDARNVTMAKDRQSMAISRERLTMSKDKVDKATQPKPPKAGTKSMVAGLTEPQRRQMYKDQLSNLDPTELAALKTTDPKKYNLELQKRVTGIQDYHTWHAEEFGVDPSGNPVDLQAERAKRSHGADRLYNQKDGSPSVLEPPGKDEITPKPKAPPKEKTYGYSEAQIKATMEKFGKSREEVLAALKAKAGK